MPVARFLGMLRDFSKHPPLCEVARAFITLPGDKSHPSVDPKTKKRVMKEAMGSGQVAPLFIRRGFEKLQADAKEKKKKDTVN